MSALSRNLSTRKLYIIGLVVPLILAVIIGYLQWRSINSMLRTRDWVRHTRLVQFSLNEFHNSLSDAESCQFRYIVTHSEVNLQHYDKFLANAQTQFDKLRVLLADNPQQLKSLAQIEPLFQTKVTAMNTSLAKAKAGDFAGAMQLVITDQSGETMLMLGNIVQQMQDDDSAFVLDRQAHYQDRFQLASALSMAAVFLCLACILITQLLLRQLSRLQAEVTLGALTQLIEYEGGMVPIDEYLRRRRDALAEHGEAQIEAERLLGLIERHKSPPVRQ